MKSKEYQFLWLTIKQFENFSDQYREKIIKAKNINKACEKFSKWMPLNIGKIDYEVKCNDEFIDVSNNKILIHLF